MTADQWEIIRQRVRDEYKVHWLLDELPAAYKYQTKDGTERIETGFPFGQIEAPAQEGEPEPEKISLLFNHVNIKVHYYISPKQPNEYKVIYFEVAPDSIDYGKSKDWKSICGAEDRDVFDLEYGEPETRTLRWTYSVEWEVRFHLAFLNPSTHVTSHTPPPQETSIPWSQRFDAYLKMNAADGHIHWFSIVNSVMIGTDSVLLVVCRKLTHFSLYSLVLGWYDRYDSFAYLECGL